MRLSNKIITNYKISTSTEDILEEPKSKEPVIKIPVYNSEDTQIEVKKDEVEIVEEPKLDEPILKITRNNEGFVVGIEVQCRCRDKILIRLDF